MLNINTKVNSLEKLQSYISYVKKFAEMKTDENFQKYIQEKCLNVVKQMATTLLFNSNYNTGMNELFSEYIENNKIEPERNGFIIYNNLSVATDSEGYDGTFSVALAFEYGTGIVGQDHPKANAWEYNIKQHTNGWAYYQNGQFWFTKGFEGFEIYRLSAEEIKKQLKDWVMNYKGKTGGASTL